MRNHESSPSSPRRTGRRTAVLVATPVLLAATALGIDRFSGDEAKPQTVGTVPGVAACGPESTKLDTISHIRATVGYQACHTALTTAANVVAGKAPVEGMDVTETTASFGTTFGKPSYTIIQKSAETVDPTNIQEYRASFAVTADGKGNLADVVTVTGNNGTDLGVIDYYKRGDGKDVYVAGFRDPHGPDEPLSYATGTPAAVVRVQDASNAALAAFIPWKS